MPFNSTRLGYHDTEVIYISDENTVDDTCSSDTWITVGNINLKQSDRQILLDANGMLT